MAESKVEDKVEDKPEAHPDDEPAGKAGWVNKEKWVEWGNTPESHVSSTMFLARGQFIDKQEKDAERINELEGQVANIGSLMADEKKASYERGVEEAETRHAKALEDGDTAGATKALQDMKDLDKEVMAPGPDPFQVWVDKNDWYSKDPMLFTAVNEMDRFVDMQANRGRRILAEEIPAHMDKVKDLVMEKYPEKFGNPARREAASTESTGGRTISTTPSEVGIADLPEEMQTRCKQYVDNGLGTEKDYIQILIDTGDIRVE